MTYERDEYMRRQEAEHDMIAMRDPAPPSPMRLINGIPAWQVAVNEAEYRAASAEMRVDELRRDTVRLAEALEHEVVSMRDESLWCRLCDQDVGADGQDHAAHCVLFNGAAE